MEDVPALWRDGAPEPSCARISHTASNARCRPAASRRPLLTVAVPPNQVGGLVADRATASRFSVESVWAPRPFGFHAAYKWLPSEQMQELLSATSRAYDELEAQRAESRVSAE